MAACVERRAACGASYNAHASGATPRKFETRQPARPAGKATADRQFQRRVRLLLDGKTTSTRQIPRLYRTDADASLGTNASETTAAHSCIAPFAWSSSLLDCS